jgi:hypothetical protein
MVSRWQARTGLAIACGSLLWSPADLAGWNLFTANTKV